MAGSQLHQGIKEGVRRHGLTLPYLRARAPLMNESRNCAIPGRKRAQVGPRMRSASQISEQSQARSSSGVPGSSHGKKTLYPFCSKIATHASPFRDGWIAILSGLLVPMGHLPSCREPHSDFLPHLPLLLHTGSDGCHGTLAYGASLRCSLRVGEGHGGPIVLVQDETRLGIFPADLDEVPGHQVGDGTLNHVVQAFLLAGVLVPEEEAAVAHECTGDLLVDARLPDLGFPGLGTRASLKKPLCLTEESITIQPEFLNTRHPKDSPLICAVL